MLLILSIVDREIDSRVPLEIYYALIRSKHGLTAKELIQEVENKVKTTDRLVRYYLKKMMDVNLIKKEGKIYKQN